MSKPILVAYASAHGSTVDVAAAIGETLSKQGFAVRVAPVRELPAINGDPAHEAVVIGSAVHAGNWLPEAVDFVRANQAPLAELPVALFCVHIQNLGSDEQSRDLRQAYLDEVRPLARPVAEGFFVGRISREAYQELMPGPFGRFIPPLDFRKYKKIRAWAESVGPRLL